MSESSTSGKHVHNSFLVLHVVTGGIFISDEKICYCLTGLIQDWIGTYEVQMLLSASFGIIGGVIKNVTTDGAFRNGLSIIYAVDLLVENCTFRATGGQGKYNGGELLTPANGGTAPRAGVDMEPDAAGDVLINVTLRAFNCLPAVELLGLKHALFDR